MQEEPIQESLNAEAEKKAKALEQFEKERQDILNSAVGGRIDNIRDRVAFILNNSISARNSDIELAWIYWETFENTIFRGNAITKEEMQKLSKMSSLTRVRAKLQNEFKLFQANDKVKRFRGVLEDEKKQEAIEDKPSYPFYTVYIDETGKTQKYLSVGGLWIIDTKSSVLAYFKLKDWIKERNIDYEFHFAEVKNHKLEHYKSFFLKFLSLYPTVGFKVIIVDKTGFSDINIAVTDLTFHLINKGIEHESKSGRALLPRALQVNIDNEEKGSDKIKLENLKERIISQKIEGLYIDRFEAVDSKDNIYLQAVDLFISSVNRKLNNPPGTSNPKDELADYILGLLDFQIDNVNISNSEIDKSVVFNLTYNSDSNLK